MPSFHRVFANSTRRTASLTLWCVGVAAVGAESQPQAPAESPWSFSGFGTFGVVQQSGGTSRGLVRNSNEDGPSSRFSASPDSRIGGQVDWSNGQTWEAALQGVLVNPMPGTPLGDMVKLAYVGLRPTSTTRLRLGRINPDLFLFADSRNVGFAMPWVRPPVDFYGFFPLTSVNGVDVEQRWSWADATWRAHATTGTARSRVSASGVRATLHSRELLALSLTREDGGLLMKLSYLNTRLNIDAPPVAALKQALGQLQALPVPGVGASIAGLDGDVWQGGQVRYLALGAQYDSGPWTLLCEGSQLRVPGSALNGRRGYVSAGWRHGMVTYYGLASRVLPDRAATVEPDVLTPLTPAIGAGAARQAQLLAGVGTAAANALRFNQSTVGAGLRWDVRPDAAFKLQIDRFSIHRHGGGGWRFNDGLASRGTLVSASVDFVVGD